MTQENSDMEVAAVVGSGLHTTLWAAIDLWREFAPEKVALLLFGITCFVFGIKLVVGEK